MERREFFKLLAITLLPTSEVFSTNTVELLPEIIKPTINTSDRKSQMEAVIKAMSEHFQEIYIESRRKAYKSIIEEMNAGSNPWTLTYKQS